MTIPVDAAPAPRARRASRTAALVTVSLATFMTYLDNNIVNVAIPAIQRDLHLTTSGLEWVVSGYLLAFAGLLLAGGRLGDVLGRRRVFLLGLGVFTLASLAAGLAGNVDVLVASRAVQGVGAALVTPTTLALLTSLYPDARERTVAIGIWSAVGALALAVGPLLGGLIAQHLTWGWIFFLNVPIGAVTVAMTYWSVPADEHTERRVIDIPGLVLSAVALLGLTYSLIEGQGKGWTSAPILTGFAIAAGAALLFAVVERTADRPDGRRPAVHRPRVHRRHHRRRHVGLRACSASTSSPRSTCRACSASPPPRPAPPSSPWHCSWPSAPCSPNGSRPASAPTARPGWRCC